MKRIKLVILTIISIIGIYFIYSYSTIEAKKSMKFDKINNVLTKYKKESNEGKVKYMNIVAQMSEDGIMKKDERFIEKRVIRLEELSNQGKLYAKYDLAEIYYHEEKLDKAMELYEELYKKGDSESAKMMALIFFQKDENKKGFFYLKESLNLGNTEINEMIGSFYYTFIYKTTKNKEEALKYFKISLKERKDTYILGIYKEFCDSVGNYCNKAD